MVNSLIDLPIRVLEGATILCTRTACDDESVLELGDRFLTEETQAELAERHPHQVSAMLESQADLE